MDSVQLNKVQTWLLAASLGILEEDGSLPWLHWHLLVGPGAPSWNCVLGDVRPGSWSVWTWGKFGVLVLGPQPGTGEEESVSVLPGRKGV